MRAWHETYGLAVTISSCSNNFGPYQHPEKLVPLAVTHLLNGQKVPIYGNGQNVRDWIYVTDHCEAIDVIARHGRIGDTYLVSAQQELSNLAMVRRLIDLLGADDRGDRVRGGSAGSRPPIRARPDQDRHRAPLGAEAHLRDRAARDGRVVPQPSELVAALALGEPSGDGRPPRRRP